MAAHPRQGRFPQVRLRRMRADSFSRALMRETALGVADLIQPIFICEGDESQPIAAMPGVSRIGIAQLTRRCKRLQTLGVPAVVLFPAIDAAQKTEDAAEAWNPNGLVQRACAAVKDAAPQLGVITDVALDPYTSHGQDGLCDARGDVVNDRTVDALVQQALSHLAAGADVVAPSDMMDGRVRAIRDACEQQGLPNARILAYSAKCASVLYAPFRQAVGSAQQLRGDKKTYQMDVANGDEALHETALDIAEGADMVMVKPGLSNLDLVWRIKQTFAMPTFAYQVSGEYAMLKIAAEQGAIDERAAVLEVLTCFKRAGCDAVLTYFAERAAEWLTEQ